jgi:hypothetical protein
MAVALSDALAFYNYRSYLRHYKACRTIVITPSVNPALTTARFGAEYTYKHRSNIVTQLLGLLAEEIR